MIKSFPLVIFFLLQINLFPKIYHDFIMVGAESIYYQYDSVSSNNNSVPASINSFHLQKDSIIINPPSVDSLALLSRIKKTDRDSISPIFQSPASDNSFILGNVYLQKNDYRFTPDYLKLFELTFLSETGNMGFPDQLFLYGAPMYQTNYLRDGIPLNDIPYIFYDNNYLQSESVDSVEVVHSPRGFLYGGFNKSVSINFLTKDFISAKPFTRIKYYQGTFGEAMLDGIFNSELYKKLYGYLDVTNRKLDSVFTNSAFSSWQVTAKLRYLISNSYNITGSYSYTKIYKALNGGVNVDSLNLLGYDVNTYLYDVIRAPVVHQSTDMDVTQHNFDIRLLAKPFEHSSSDFNLYYKFDGQSLNNIDDNSYNFEKTKNKLYGASLNQKYSEDFYNLNLIGIYEHSDIHLNTSPPLQNSLDSYQDKVNLFSLAGIAGINIAPGIKTSLFYKYSTMMNDMPGFFRNNKESKGVGFDLEINTSLDLSFYLGYSFLNDYYNQKYLGNGEVSIIFSPENLYLKLSLFSRNNPINNYSGFSNLNFPYLLLFNLQPYTLLMNNPYVMGIGVNLVYKFWIMSFENNTTYYSGNYIKDSLRYNGLLGIPEFYSRSGVYVSDSLFSSNLNLKAGFVFTLYGKINYLDASGSIFETDPSYKIDFTLAGRIRNAATVYFTWENLLDKKYYLVPFYPALGRNLRFGIAWDLFN